jgi:hypothetical protein
MLMNHFLKNYFTVILCIKCFDTYKVLLIRMQVLKIYNKLNFSLLKKVFPHHQWRRKKKSQSYMSIRFIRTFYFKNDPA